ncbi:peroxiredoxin [Emcibacter sp. SYSU 3D8]|uniref:peroxiredoxin n=1 Tax=Emcibacter sp. SYSU 3D8 TaxID=3133969 RepID=UPI0031FE8AD4
MRRLLLTAAIVLAAALPAHAALKAGTAAPDFAAPASLAGKQFEFSLAEARKTGPVVVYFYPSAYTGGCNVQAHAFAEEADNYRAAGATIIGVSQDSIARLNDFSADPEYCAGKFPVASDADGAISKSFDLQTMQGQPGMKDSRGAEIDHAFTERTTFVIGADGRIEAVLSTTDDKIAPVDHAARALEIVKTMKQP